MLTTLSLIAVAVVIAYLLGKRVERNKHDKAHIDALETSVEITEGVRTLSESELNDRLRGDKND